MDGAGGWYVFFYLLIFEFLHLEIIKKTSFSLINRTSLTSFRSVIVQQQLLFILFYTKRLTRPYFNGVLSMYMDNIFLDWGSRHISKQMCIVSTTWGPWGKNRQLCLNSPYVCIGIIIFISMTFVNSRD